MNKEERTMWNQKIDFYRRPVANSLFKRIRSRAQGNRHQTAQHRIVARQAELRTQIGAIVADLEGDTHGKN
jgi:hypothetical protein